MGLYYFFDKYNGYPSPCMQQHAPGLIGPDVADRYGLSALMQFQNTLPDDASIGFFHGVAIDMSGNIRDSAWPHW